MYVFAAISSDALPVYKYTAAVKAKDECYCRRRSGKVVRKNARGGERELRGAE